MNGWPKLGGGAWRLSVGFWIAVLVTVRGDWWIAACPLTDGNYRNQTFVQMVGQGVNHFNLERNLVDRPT